ncbi:MAG: thioredoxin-dependent thiol peroxidase [Spirochaetaceae bacterium]
MEEKLDNGDKCPNFSLLDQNADKVSNNDFLGKKILIYFYPRANTPGCTTQSCEVRDNKDEFLKLGVHVLGISPDTPKKQSNFDNKFSLGFKLLSDEDHSVAESFGVWAEKKLYGKVYMGIVRSSFLIDEKGNILKAWYKVSPKNTVPEAIKYLNS